MFVLLIGDTSRPEVLKNFDAANARACVMCFGDMTTTNKVCVTHSTRRITHTNFPYISLSHTLQAIVAMRKLSADVPIIVSARDSAHQVRLESMFG